jgi:hypothetical protein
MNKYSKQLFDLAYESSGGRPEDINQSVDPSFSQTDVTIMNLEKRIKRCEDLILMQAEINQKITEILKNE